MGYYDRKNGGGIPGIYILLGIAALIAVAFLLATSSGGQEEDFSRPVSEVGGTINVIVSILPQKEFVERVGGEHVRVSVLIPPGGSPATYEPGPGDLAKVEDAHVYFMVGHIPFELSHTADFASLNPTMGIVDTSENVELRHFGEDEEHSHGEDAGEHEDEGFLGGLLGHEESDSAIDPHTWLSPENVKLEVDAIAQALIEMDPANEEEYLENAETYKRELDALHAQVASDLSGIKSRRLMVFHPAWGYFADEFGLEQIAIEQGGKEPTPAQLREIVDTAKAEGVGVIFVQSQFSEEVAESVAEETGAVVVSIDPLAEDYIANLENVGRTIAHYLDD